MLKINERLKIADIQTRIEARFKELGALVPFLSVASIQREEKINGAIIDIVVKIMADKVQWRWIVECKKIGQPREVRHSLLELRAIMAECNDKNVYGVVAAPFLSVESRRLCVESGVGYVDLAGNARLSFGTVFIELQAVGNPFMEQRSLRSIFTPKSGRVLKVLLEFPLHAWKVQDLVSASGVSMGQVSNVRKLLLQREWARLEPGGLYLNRPQELLEAWKASYELPHLSQKSWYTLLDGKTLEDAARASFAEADGGAHVMYASYSAARWYAPYARQSTAFFYVDSIGKEILTRLLNLKSVDRGGNVVILETPDDSIFARRIEAAPGVWCADPITTWLDLNAAGERGEEAADNLLQQVLIPGWKERRA